jgi:hypothetical protein
LQLVGKSAPVSGCGTEDIAMSFEDIARQMNERAGGKPGMPVDVEEVKRRQHRFQAGVMIVAGLCLTAVSLGLNILLAATGWVYSTGILLTLLGVVMLCIGVGQFWKNLRGPRKVLISEARVVARDSRDR